MHLQDLVLENSGFIFYGMLNGNGGIAAKNVDSYSISVDCVMHLCCAIYDYTSGKMYASVPNKSLFQVKYFSGKCKLEVGDAASQKKPKNRSSHSGDDAA